jgi:succinyl-CoA synthetase beta subunit
MDLFEYQGKQYFARYGIAVSPGDVADTVDEALAVAIPSSSRRRSKSGVAARPAA